MDREQKALRAWRLSQRLNDERKLVVALRYYDHHLPIGKWTRLGPPRRERSRRLHHERAWLAHLSAARRLGGLVFRNRIDEKGKAYTEYYLSRDIWQSATSRLIFSSVAEDARESLWLPEERRRKEAREQQKRETAFKCALLDPEIAWQFHRLPVGWQLQGEIEKFSDRLPLLLERTKEYLLRDIDKETRTRFARSQNKPANESGKVSRSSKLENAVPGANGGQSEALAWPGEGRQKKKKPVSVESELARRIRSFLIRQSI